MKRVYFDAKPKKFEPVGNGSFRYRWDIREEQAPKMNEEDDSERTQYSCNEVTVWMPVTSNKITQAVIGAMWESDYEQKLVNEFNAANLGVYGDKTSEEARKRIEAYRIFLTERNVLKAQVDADCKELGIE